MKRLVFSMIIFTLMIVSLCVPIESQSYRPGQAGMIVNYPALPATCIPQNGQLVYLTTGNTGIYSCTARNTWTRMDTSGFFNVKAFGAVGNGVANDTVAINAAVAAMNALPGTIYFPRGNYRYNTAAGIVLLPGQRILGEGPKATQLTYFDVLGNDAINIVGNVADAGRAAIYIENIRLTGAVGAGAGIDIDNANGVKINYCIIENFPTFGINVTLAAGGFCNVLEINLTEINACTVAGIRLDDSLAAAQISHVLISNGYIIGNGIGISVPGGVNFMTVQNSRITTGAGQTSCINAVGGWWGGGVTGSYIETVADVSPILLGNGVALNFSSSLIRNLAGGGVQQALDIGAATGVSVTGCSLISVADGFVGTGNNILYVGNVYTGGGLAVAAAMGASLNGLLSVPRAGGVTTVPGLGFPQIAFAAIGAPPNGTVYYCSDCTIASPCAGGGTGSIAKRLNGVWVCN